MRVLIVNYEFPPLGGGAATASFHISRGLAEKGCEVTVLTSHFKGLKRQEVIDGVNIRRIPVWRKRKDRCSVVEMVTFMVSAAFYGLIEMKQRRIDVGVVFFTIPCGHVGLLGKWFWGIPYIVSLRGGDVPGFMGKNLAFYHILTRPVIRKIWVNSAGVVANSQGLCKLAQETLPNYPFRIIPNGVDLDLFHPAGEKKNTEPIRILFVGRLSRQKGVDVLLEALGCLLRLGKTDWTLRIFGNGPEKKRLQEVAHKEGISEKLCWDGWVLKSDMPKVYRGADIFVLPSRDEGMPNALLEAMASGLACVATRVSGSEEPLGNMPNCLVEVDDVKGLTKALQRLLESASLRMQLGKEMREIAEGYSWRDVALAYHELFAEVIDKKQ